jgi:hypothetical protein
MQAKPNLLPASMTHLPLARRLLPATLTLAASLVVLLAVAPSANAALSFRFDRASARVDATVVAFEPGFPSAPVGVTVHLIPTRLPGVRPDSAGGYLLAHPPTAHAIKLGQPHLTRSHLLTIRFRVPNVVPGDYTTAFWCRTCTKGGDFFASTYWGEAWTGKPGTVLRVKR